MAYVYVYVLTFSLLAKFLLLCFLLGCLVWAWGLFLDSYEHDPGRVRAAMFGGIAVIMSTELGLASSGATCGWVACVSLVVNIWGGVDALLRYPASHDLDSFFSMKQFTLLLVKALAYTFGMASMTENIGKFLAVILVNTLGSPIMYLMALPMDPAEQVIKDDAYDIDLISRVWQIAVCSNERRSCISTCRSWWNRYLLAATEVSPWAHLAVCAASPDYRRRTRHQGRCV